MRENEIPTIRIQSCVFVMRQRIDRKIATHVQFRRARLMRQTRVKKTSCELVLRERYIVNYEHDCEIRARTL